MTHSNFESSNSDQPNILRAAGLSNRELWPGTRAALEADGLVLGADLGQGGFGIVIAAREKGTNRKLAVKVLDEPTNDKKLGQFHREHRVLASETVPLHIVPHLRYGREPAPAAKAQPYLVMEQIDGQTVHEYARINELSVERKIELVERVFAAFGELHERGIVHGDPSPKNVMVESGDRVRIIDFGGSRDLSSVLVSLTSQTQAGGTPGFSPLARLTGEEKASLWSDLYGAAAVAFHLFTGKKVSDVEESESSYCRHLAAAGVPGGIAAIVAKGLRSRDPKYGPGQDNPRLFQSAKEMADAVAAWRTSREGWRRFRSQIAVALLIAAPLAGIAWWSYGQFQSLQHAVRRQAISSLQQEIARLENRTHPAVAARLKDIEFLLAELHDAERTLDVAKSRGAQAKLIDAMHETLAISRGLGRSIPLRESLGLVLLKMPWVTAAPTIAAEKKRLEQIYQSLGEQLDRGELDPATVALASFHRDLAELAAKNIAADAADQARLQLEQEREALTERVRKLDGFQPVATLAASAEKAWKSGDFLQASSLFGQARQKLTETLPQLETDDERAARIAQQTTRLRDEATSLRQQLTATASERDEQFRRVRELESQITTITAQSAEDRESRKAAETRANDLLSKNSAGAKMLADLQGQVKLLEPQAKELAELKPKHQAVTTERDELQRRLEPLQKQVAILEAAVKNQTGPDATKVAAEVASLQQQINAVNADDWQAAHSALGIAVAKYQQVAAEKKRLLAEYSETSPTIQKVNVTLAQHQSLVESALAVRDKAESALFQKYAGQIEAKQKERQHLLDVEGLLPNSTRVRRVDQGLNDLAAKQKSYQAGHGRASKGQGDVTIDEMIKMAGVASVTPGSNRVVTLGGVDLTFVGIPLPPNGRFRMGTPQNEPGRVDDEDQVEVTLTKPYAALVTEVTQAMWTAVMKTTPWQGKEYVKHGPSYPAVYVSANDADDWCEKATALGRQTGMLAGNERFLLPTEAQWEWMARGGTTTAYFHGDDPKQLGEYAWFDQNAWDIGEKYAHEVCKKQPNAYGLFDTSGNVWEWCRDYYGNKLPGGTDPFVAAGSSRVVRGGSFDYGESLVRVGDRNCFGATSSGSLNGFRVVLSVE